VRACATCRFFITLVVILTATAALPAQELTWNLGDVLRAGIDNNLGLKQEHLSVAEARGKMEDAWNKFLPQLDAGTSLSRTGGPDSRWSASLSATASLRLSSSVRLEIEQLQNAYESSLASYASSVADLEKTLKETYFSVLLTERRIEIARSNLDLAEQQYAQIRLRFQNGRASELDMLSARVAAAKRKPELLTLQQNKESSLSKLKDLTGLAPDAALQLEGRIDPPEFSLNPESLVSEGVSNSQEIRSQELQLEGAKRDKRISLRTNKVPTFSLSYSYSPSVSPPFDGSLWTAPSTWQGGSLTFRLSIPLDPLVPHSQADNAVRSNDYRIEKAQLGLQETRRSVQSQVMDITRRMQLSQQKLEVLRLAVEAASARYRQTVSAYETGGRQLLDVENAQTEMQQAQLDVANEMYNYIVAIIELETITGKSFLLEK